MKKKNYRVLALLLAMIFVLTGCGAKSDAAYDSAGSVSPDYDYKNETGSWADSDAEADVEIEEDMDADITTDGGTASADDVQDTGRKLIKRYYLSMETREYDELISYIKDATAAAGGYIESANLSGTSIEGSGRRSAYYVLRVPAIGAASFLEGLQGAGHVTYQTEDVDDVTLAYVDTESRIAALRIEQETLLEMLKEADTLDTILGIQSRLTEVRYELESYESRLRSYDNLIDYTTISVDVSEVIRVTATNDGSFGERLKDNFADGFYDFGQNVQELILWFAGAIPTLFVLAVLVAAAIVVVKKVKKSARSKKGLKAVLEKNSYDLNSEEKEK